MDFFFLFELAHKVCFPGCFSHGLAGKPRSKEGRELRLMDCLCAKRFTLLIPSMGLPWWPVKGLLLQGHLFLHKESGVLKSCRTGRRIH